MELLPFARHGKLPWLSIQDQLECSIQLATEALNNQHLKPKPFGGVYLFYKQQTIACVIPNRLLISQDYI